MTEIADGEGDGEAHLGGHHDERHVPAQHADDEEKSAARLRKSDQDVSAIR